MALEYVQDGDEGSSARLKINNAISQTDKNQTQIAQQAQRISSVENSVSELEVNTFAMDEVTTPVNVPENNTLWTDIFAINRTNMPKDGRYFVTISAIISPNTSAKSYLIRQVNNGVPYQPVSDVASDSSNRIQEIYRTYYDVSGGIMDFKMQMQLATGQGNIDLVIEYALLDYEWKI